MRLLILSILILFTIGCTQRLEISGEGSIGSYSQTRDCSPEQSPCEFLIVGAYDETYYATPAENYEFIGWEGPGCDHARPFCTYRFGADTVRKLWFKSFTLKAIFERDPSLGRDVTVSGKITYTRVSHEGLSAGLDYTNTAVLPARRIVVQAENHLGHVIASTTTDLQGNYAIPLLSSDTVRIKAVAQLRAPIDASGMVTIRDNTASDAIYVASGSLLVADYPSTRNLHLSSGWNGSTYSRPRAAAPFAILDSIYGAMEKVAIEQPTFDFGNLDVYWSKENTTVNGDRSLGQIGTSFYQDKVIYILGDANNDTDEYDDHVIVHEWGHYLEDAFSRSDSIGGPHGDADILDMRLAFGEGFGNALSAIVLNDSLYKDSSGASQGNGFGFDVQSNNNTNPGWYSEGSIQSIILDLYDDDADDSVNLGFGPIFSVLTTTQVNTDALTSIFPFMAAIKANNTSASAAIDQLLINQQINSAVDDFGSNETNDAGNANTLPIYSALSAGSTVNRCVINSFNSGGDRNKLSNARLFTFTPSTAGNYQITATRTSGAASDPDMALFENGQIIAIGQSIIIDSETLTASLSASTYILELIDYNLGNNICFDVSATAI
jgi:hypothetical protein